MEAFHTTKGSQLSKCKLTAQGCSARATPDILSGPSYQLQSQEVGFWPASVFPSNRVFKTSLSDHK